MGNTLREKTEQLLVCLYMCVRVCARKRVRETEREGEREISGYGSIC